MASQAGIPRFNPSLRQSIFRGLRAQVLRHGVANSWASEEFRGAVHKASGGGPTGSRPNLIMAGCVCVRIGMKKWPLRHQSTASPALKLSQQAAKPQHMITLMQHIQRTVCMQRSCWQCKMNCARVAQCLHACESVRRMTSDVCLIWPAINAVREGYNVQVTRAIGILVVHLPSGTDHCGPHV